MKKLAFPVEKGTLSHHFGHSREFVFVDIDDSGIVKSTSKEPPPHAEGTIPRWLIAENTTDLLVGGIGPKAINILNEAGINVYAGVKENTADILIKNFMEDELEYGQNYCHH